LPPPYAESEITILLATYQNSNFRQTPKTPWISLLRRSAGFDIDFSAGTRIAPLSCADKSLEEM